MTEGGRVAAVDVETFDVAVAEGMVLVDFWAAWCGPCHALTPVLEELAGELADVRIAKVDVADHPGIGERFEIRSLPTLILFRDGEPIKRMFGAKNKRQLRRVIDEANGVAGDRPAAADS